MAILNFLGFDLFGAAQVSGEPTLMAGVPAAMLNVNHRTFSTGTYMGVTGLAGDKFGEGAELRNALVCSKNTTPNSFTVLEVLPVRNLRTNVSYRHCLGFRFKEVGSQNPATTVTLISVDMSTVLLSISTSGVFTLSGQATSLTREFGREYYIELIQENVVGQPSPRLKFIVDGVLVLERSAPNWGPDSDRNVPYCIGIHSSASDNRARRWLIGDLYWADGTGDAPYNDALGPQKVLPVYASEVVANTWEPSSGSDPVAMINQADGRNDTTFLTSPTNGAEGTFKFDWKTNSRSVVNGVRMYARGQRDAGAVRNLDVQVKNGNGDVISSGGTAQALSTTWAEIKGGQILPNSTLQVPQLTHAALQNSVVSIQSPAGT